VCVYSLFTYLFVIVWSLRSERDPFSPKGTANAAVVNYYKSLQKLKMKLKHTAANINIRTYQTSP
jgi:hypothetical protein